MAFKLQEYHRVSLVSTVPLLSTVPNYLLGDSVSSVQLARGSYIRVLRLTVTVKLLTCECYAYHVYAFNRSLEMHRQIFLTSAVLSSS